MMPKDFDSFVDPISLEPFALDNIIIDGRNIKSARIVSANGSPTAYCIADYIPRFVGKGNYTDNFGYQWQTHASTQLDSINGSTYSKDRLFSTTNWLDSDNFEGERILEAGSGAGRFTEVLLKTGAQVYSFDLSNAVNANWKNNKNDNLILFQANIYEIPLPRATFDKVICLGVLQHTPDVKKSFLSLAAMLRSGGQLIVDIYPDVWRHNLHWKYLMRPVTRHIAPERLYRFVSWYAPKLIPLAKVLRRLSGGPGARLVPIMDQSDKFMVSRELQREWTILDTFDALSAYYDQPQTAENLKSWFEEAGFKEFDVFYANGLIGRGIKA